MSVVYTDPEIVALISAAKTLPANWQSRASLKAKRGHSEARLDVLGQQGNEFRVVLRQNTRNPLDFSVILGALVPQSTQVFRLRRYNGRSHQHTNQIEGDSFFDFHIHEATARYQELGAREDTFAKPTDRYGSFQDALQCLLLDAGFAPSQGPQGDLFGQGARR